uniref:Photosystem II Psb27 protein n=1 Tax=Caenorhabditis tropicalis TaxID=1561998 RepID=A0A1I7URM4_9PELO
MFRRSSRHYNPVLFCAAPYGPCSCNVDEPPTILSVSSSSSILTAQNSPVLPKLILFPLPRCGAVTPAQKVLLGKTYQKLEELLGSNFEFGKEFPADKVEEAKQWLQSIKKVYRRSKKVKLDKELAAAIKQIRNEGGEAFYQLLKVYYKDLGAYLDKKLYSK